MFTFILFLVVSLISGCGNAANNVSGDIDSDNAANNVTGDMDSENRKSTDVKSPKELKIEHIKQFGGEAFTDMKIDDLSNVKVDQQGDIVQVTWSVDDNFYQSVAEKGEWVAKDQLIFKGDWDHEYIKFGLSIIDVYEEGEGSSKKMIIDQHHIWDEEAPINTIYEGGRNYYPLFFTSINTSRGEALLILESQDKDDPKRHQIILENDPDNPIHFIDEFKVFSVNDASNLYADLKENVLYFSNGRSLGQYTWQNVKQFNISSGEPKYDNSGQDIIADIKGGFILGAEEGVYIGSFTNPIGTGNNGNSYKVGVYDEKFNELIKSTYLPFTKSKNDIGSFNANKVGNEVHLWNLVEFQRRTSLELIILTQE